MWAKHPLFFLVPDRTQPEVAFVDAERRLGLRQLDVRFPKFFVAPIRHVAAQKIAAFAQGGPVAPRLDLFPMQGSRGRRPTFSPRCETSPAARLFCPSKRPNRCATTSGCRRCFWQAAAIRCKPFLDPLLETAVHGLFFLAAIAAAAKHEGFVAVRRRTELHFQARRGSRASLPRAVPARTA